MAAMKLNVQELVIDHQEAALLASAIKDVQQFYGVDVPEEVALWLNLATALGTVYGPRVVVITAKRKRAKAEAKQNAPKPEPVSESPNGGFVFDTNGIAGMHSSGPL